MCGSDDICLREGREFGLSWSGAVQTDQIDAMRDQDWDPMVSTAFPQFFEIHSHTNSHRHAKLRNEEHARSLKVDISSLGAYSSSSNSDLSTT